VVSPNLGVLCMAMSGPLESTQYFVLVALAAEPQHGSALRGQINGDSLGVYLRDSTLYFTLKSLLRDGYIEELPTHDRRQRVYELTEKGERRLELEARTHRRVAALALERL